MEPGPSNAISDQWDGFIGRDSQKIGFTCPPGQSYKEITGICGNI